MGFQRAVTLLGARCSAESVDYSVPSRTDSRWPEGGERLQTRREKFRKKLAEKLRSPKTSLESWSIMSFKKILRLSKNMQGRCTKSSDDLFDCQHFS